MVISIKQSPQIWNKDFQFHWTVKTKVDDATKEYDNFYLYYGNKKDIGGLNEVWNTQGFYAIAGYKYTNYMLEYVKNETKCVL